MVQEDYAKVLKRDYTETVIRAEVAKQAEAEQLVTAVTAEVSLVKKMHNSRK